MTDRQDWRLLVPQPVRRLPADLAGVVVLVVCTAIVVFVPVVNETPLRVVFGLPFVLFVPGYAFVAALFPEAGPATGTETPTDESETRGTVDGRGIDGIERVALSFGLSIAIVPLIGLVLNFTPWGIRLGPIMVAVAGLTLAFVAVGAYRRHQLPVDERFRVPYREWIAAAREEVFEPETRTDAALNVLLVVSILLATASVGYAVMVPKQGEAFTELYVVTEGEDGELVAAGYPTTMTVGESSPLVVGVGNHEHHPMNYTVVVALQRARIVDNETRVSESQVLTRLRTGQVAANGTWQRSLDVTPTMTGTHLRLAILLYRGSPPTDVGVETAYRWNALWVNVTAPNG